MKEHQQRAKRTLRKKRSTTHIQRYTVPHSFISTNEENAPLKGRLVPDSAVVVTEAVVAVVAHTVEVVAV